MNPKPTSSRHAATSAGPRSIATPSSSSTSALPQALEAARLPCFAMRAPAADATMALTVEMLKEFERSPPVPQVSIASGGAWTLTAASRSADANPAISSTVSPRRCMTARSPPSCAGVASPFMTKVIAARASSRESVSAPDTAMSASFRSNGPHLQKYKSPRPDRDEGSWCHPTLAAHRCAALCLRRSPLAALPLRGCSARVGPAASAGQSPSSPDEVPGDNGGLPAPPAPPSGGRRSVSRGPFRAGPPPPLPPSGVALFGVFGLFVPLERLLHGCYARQVAGGKQAPILLP